MLAPIIPTDAGLIRFYETLKPALERDYGLTLRATVTDFEVLNSEGKLVATGDTYQWLKGFVNGLDVSRNL